MNARGWFWCCFAIFIATLGIGGTGILILSANSDPSFGVEPDYYSKALAWNDTAAQRETNTKLGWTLTVSLGDRADEAVVDVRDGSGVRVEGARITGIAFANALSSQRHEITASEAPPRGYIIKRPSAHEGSWRLRLRVERGSDVFTWEGDHTFAGGTPPGAKR